VSISGSPTRSYLGGEVNFALTVRSLSPYLLLPDVILTIDLGPGMNLVGPPKYTIGNGCTGSTQKIVCDVNYLAPGLTGMYWFGVQFSEVGTHILAAHVTSDGFPGPAPTVYLIPVAD
jgi:hypothetical protein